MAYVITGALIAWLEISPADEDTAGTPAGTAGPSGLLTLTRMGDGPDVRRAGRKPSYYHYYMCIKQTHPN